MLLSEYKSKELLHQYGLKVPSGRIARTADEAEAACAGILSGSYPGIASKKYAVKAQIAAGGRGLAGGVRFAATPSSVRDEAARMLGRNLVTQQTGPEGETVASVYVEAALDLKAQYFVAFALDLDSGAPMLLASSDGGVEFEQKARMDSDTVHTLVIPDEDRVALTAFLSDLGVDEAAADPILAARRAFLDNDMTLLEINPFAKTAEGDWVAIDAKITLDASAAFRHPEFETMLAEQAIPGVEAEAAKSNINFVKLDGDMGVVVNGAGLGLATNDMIADAGGKAANFMDIRTTATSFDIAKGVELLLKDPKVKVILLNVHGGGMTVCDTVAEGVAFAYSRAERKLPCVARLAGTNADWGLRILKDRKVPAEVVSDMTGAVKRAVALAQGAR
ncbi:succinyl-CoA synthetase subunit beta [Silicimonas algicola]|uniref:Succinyl-CoA synthetase beta subunit n=1 Tax=Silicimonas algicola TaxID=1826607 RepID=A0A316G168_9RHOB|nr:ATP-grasp domain-containing protein [Silicimonas algicola]AZQ68181.1 succinyl-CoA synthetase subunit beta [Silicimonas algicola]PWK54694.1 succinyl-CoA synthetase beta subunit [Silicimonas algicola]